MTYRDAAYFVKEASAPPEDNWVIRYNNLKRLHKLVLRYFECVVSHIH